MRRSQRDREFEEFVVAAWPRLRRAAYLLCQDDHEADDLVQTVLASAYASWARAPWDDVYAYVRRSLVNAYIDSTRRRRPVPVETQPGRPVAADSSIEDRSELAQLLAPLTARERAIVVWRYYLDASEADVAEQLGVSTGTVKSTASRALARLRATATHTTTEGESR